MKTFVVVNGTAGAGRALRLWPRVKDELASIRPFDFGVTGRAGHAVELARDAARGGYGLVVAFGGDGTVFETANGLMREDRALATLGVIPAGSGNDIARTLGIPREPAAACELLRDPTPRHVDMFRVNDRYVVGTGGVGFDAEVAALANRWPKYLPGTITYVLAIFARLATFSPVEVELTLDGQTQRTRVLLVAVGNTQYYGGGMRVCPQARVDDGLLEVIVAGPLSKAQTIRLLPTIFSGRHILHPLVTCYRAREVTISSAVPLSIQTDGEVVGQLPVTFRVLPGALPVVAGEPLSPMEL
ncbi:MAG: diacylglycerol kinase family lipid kinase [bacterium]|nr:diacylglycerol kinase family lipid kinase [bacterium]